MSVTTQEAVERYQSQVPRLKYEFAERLKEIKRQFPAGRDDKQFVQTLAEAIEAELRKRLTLASDSLIEALDAGWRPDENQLDQAYTDCLNALDYRRHTFDDIYSAAGHIPLKVAGPYGQIIGETMIACSGEARSKLLMRLRGIKARQGSGERRPEYTRSRGRRVDARRFKLSHVELTNYKSIAECSVHVGDLTILVGANGAGKSNFIDSISFVNDALFNSLENAIRDRGGIAQLIRQTPGADPYLAEVPAHSDVPFFEINLQFELVGGGAGAYRIRIGQSGTEFHVLEEECSVTGVSKAGEREFFVRKRSQISSSAELRSDPKEDRLYLPSMSTYELFEEVLDGLTGEVTYDFDLGEIRDAQPIDSGSYLADDCWNIASVVSRLQSKHPRIKQRVEAYLRRIVRSRVVLRTRTSAPYIFLEYWQTEDSDEAKPLKLLASSMSDGTLRATALLLALLQPPQIDDEIAINLVAFEEPETGLQPAALRVIFDAIQESSESRQVVFTTHSPELLENKNLQVESMLAVEFRDGSTKIGPVDSVTMAVLRDGLLTPSELLRQADALRPQIDET